MDRYALINGVRLHYREWGDTTAGLVIALHGSRGHCHTFDRYAPPLSEHFRVVAPSIRGHGNSDWADPNSYSFEQLAEDVLGLSKALGADRFAISGQSLGGIIGSYCASKYPMNVSKLILGDIGPDTQEQYENAINAPQMPRSSAPSHDAFMEFTRRFVDSPVHHALLFENLAMLQEDGSWTSRGDPAFFDHIQRPTVEEFWERVNAIECATLLLRGENSTFLDRDVALQMENSMRDCTLVEIEGVGHPLLTEAEEALLEHSLKFLVGV